MPPLRLRKSLVCRSSGVRSFGRGACTAPCASDDREATEDDCDVTDALLFGSVIWTTTTGCSGIAKPNDDGSAGLWL